MRFFFHSSVSVCHAVNDGIPCNDGDSPPHKQCTVVVNIAVRQIPSFTIICSRFVVAGVWFVWYCFLSKWLQ